MDLNSEPYCLVLGGGGAKGVYHIGVWQALSELNIPVNAFIGNSIGAIIAAFLAQGAEEELLEIARSMNLQSLIRLHKDKALADEQSIKDHPLSYWRGVYKNIVEKRGLDTTPMRETLESVIKEEVIRDSGYDFGVTTVNLSDFKSREVFIESMEPNQLINYVMASAAFPGFESPNIEGKKYVDGGLYDNIPFRMAKRRGYRKIILVDISGIGFNRRPKTDGTQTVYIKNSIDMGNAFDFDPDFTSEFWQLGYLDTLRTFGRLQGYKYFLHTNEEAETNWQAQLSEPEKHALRKSLPDHMRHDRRLYLALLEVCALFLDVPRIQAYSYQELVTEIAKKVDDIESAVEALIDEHQLEVKPTSGQIFDAFVKEIIESKKRNDHPYFYLKLIQHFEPSKTLKLAESGVRKLNSELDVLDIFLKYCR